MRHSSHQETDSGQDDLANISVGAGLDLLLHVFLHGVSQKNIEHKIFPHMPDKARSHLPNHHKVKDRPRMKDANSQSSFCPISETQTADAAELAFVVRDQAHSS